MPPINRTPLAPLNRLQPLPRLKPVGSSRTNSDAGGAAGGQRVYNSTADVGTSKTDRAKRVDENDPLQHANHPLPLRQGDPTTVDKAQAYSKKVNRMIAQARAARADGKIPSPFSTKLAEEDNSSATVTVVSQAGKIAPSQIDLHRDSNTYSLGPLTENVNIKEPAMSDQKAAKPARPSSTRLLRSLPR